MIPVVCTHTIAAEPLRAWFAEHGLDIRDIREATVSIGYPGHHGHPAWLDATWWKRNAQGDRYWDGLSKEAASGSSSIPLRSWPPLTPVLTGLAPTLQHGPGYTVRNCEEGCVKCAAAEAET